jgi:hypothetical protein
VRLLNLSLVRSPYGPARYEPKRRCGRLNRTACDVPQHLSVVTSFQQRISAVADRNIDVGKTGNRKPALPVVERLAKTHSPSAPHPRVCRAMLQQCADSGRGNQSAPQKFVQLVGCRDLKAGPQPAGRTRPAPVKR